jgi:hypothetical protein
VAGRHAPLDLVVADDLILRAVDVVLTVVQLQQQVRLRRGREGEAADPGPGNSFTPPDVPMSGLPPP